MVDKILTGAGLVKDETYTESHFISPPRDVSYAVYLDDVTRRGADNRNLITEHATTIEVYEYFKDVELEKRIEGMFDALSIPYEKDPRYWIEDQQLYQVIYNFNHIEKETITNG